MNVHISSVEISSSKRKTEAHGVLVKTLKFVSLKLLKGTVSFIWFSNYEFFFFHRTHFVQMLNPLP